MRDPPHDELVLEVVEPVKVFENQPELPHQRRVLEVFLQGWVELGHEEGIVLRERRDEGRVDGEVILRRMAGAAGTPVAGERLVEEEVSSLRDELGLRIWGRWSGLTAREPDDAQENRWNQHHSGNRAQRSHAPPTEHAPRAGERHGQSIGERYRRTLGECLVYPPVFPLGMHRCLDSTPSDHPLLAECPYLVGAKAAEAGQYRLGMLAHERRSSRRERRVGQAHRTADH